MLHDCAYKYRFYPTPEQAGLLNRTFGCVRVVYNRARSEREKAWKENKESFGFCQTSRLLTEMKRGESMAWLREVSCVPLQQSLRHLDTAYRNFFRRTARYPGFRSKHGKQSAEFTKSGFNYSNGKLKLAKMAEPLDVRWSRELPSEPTTVTVSKEPDGKWYIACRVIKDCEQLSGGGEIGIDLGLKEFATLSSGEKVVNPRFLRKRQTKLARLQRRLARKQKGSNNRAKARLKVARAHSAVRNARNDFLQKLSSRLIRENQTICIEDLSIKGLSRTRLAKSVADVGWGAFVQMLKYKARFYGRNLVQIDRFFPSTKTCSVCGTTGHKLTLSDREWDCPDCGTHHDRDHNAAMNILAAGLAVSVCGEDVSPCVASAA